MGWSFEGTPSKLKDFIAERCRDHDWSCGNGVKNMWRCLTHRYVMSNPGCGRLWKVVERGRYTSAGTLISLKDRFIALDLIRWGGGKDCGWGYKDMTEHSGPCDVDCPLKYLEMTDEPKPCNCVPDPTPDWPNHTKPGCEECWSGIWRARVRVYHETRTMTRRLAVSLKPGDKVYLRGCTVGGADWVVVRTTKPLVFEQYGSRVVSLSMTKIDFDRTLAEKTDYNPKEES